jgi:amino acid adenylation domain-containing protein
MADITQDSSDLSSPEKRAQLEKLLREKLIEPRRFPLTFAQQRLWFLEQLYPGSPVNNIQVAMRVKGPLKAAVLEWSFNEILRRHEALRTSFSNIDGQSVQIVAPALKLVLTLIEIEGGSVDEREAEVTRLINQDASEPFDLFRGPLIRVSLLRLDEQDHVLLLSLHHIVSDLWSIEIIFRELSELYTSLCSDLTPSLPGLPVQYGDFAYWQRSQYDDRAAQEELSYWTQKLDQAPLVLDLPTDYPRPAIQTTNGAYEYMPLSQGLFDSLQALSAREGVTLFMTLIAAFETLIYRYTGKTDFTIGTPIANRNRTDIESLIGFFANTLVLRAGLSDNPSFQELLSRTREEVLEILAHQRFPFEKLVEALRPERDLSHTPLFQVMFVLNQSWVDAIDLPGLTLNAIETKTGSAKFDLTLFMSAKNGLSACFQYNTDLFASATIKRMLGHLDELLKGIGADPQKRISELSILTERERELLCGEWNDTQADYQFDSCIHRLFEAQVERAAHAIAVTYDNEHLSYFELNRRSNRIAHYLRRRGVGPEEIVGVHMERSPEMIVAMMAILKAGGAYLPLDPAYPFERLVFMTKDSRTRMVLTQEKEAAGLADGDLEMICLNQLRNQLSAESDRSPDLEISPTNLAYVIYTSGSTGKPKGAMLHHRGICNRLLWGIIDYELGETDRVLSKTPISFDVSVWEIFAPLLAGSQVVIARPGGEQDSSYLITLIREQKITHADFVPSMLQLFLIEDGLEHCRSLKRITAAGEALTSDLTNRFFDRLDAELYNLYGPTEASLAVTYWPCRPGGDQRTIPIGRPMNNVQIYLLDPDLQPVPIGAQGELYIGGVAVGRGYFDRPDLTADRFIPNPFDPEPNARLYKTGDLARYLPTGDIEFLGRLDHQVKVRGFRIELGEIEAVLADHPAVREALVVTREEHRGDRRLIAYLVANSPAPSVTELRNFIRGLLPEYMVPSQFVFLQTMPLTRNGKVDRDALPKPDSMRPALKVDYVPPSAVQERSIAEIWRQTLGIDKVGIDDNFFDLGGHSLHLLQVHHQLKAALGGDLAMVELFKYPTIRSLAGYLDQRHDHDEDTVSRRAQARGEKRSDAINRRRRLSSEKG